MKSGIKICIVNYLLAGSLFSSGSVLAEMYKSVDAEGNVVYSDQPSYNSKKFTPPSLTVFDAPAVKPENTEDAVAEEPARPFSYSAFSIAAPQQDETIWNSPQVSVSLQVKPALNIDEEHNFWLLLDGNTVVKNSQSLSLSLGRLDRGEHTLLAQIRDKKGKIIKSSNTVTVHIKNSVVPRVTPQ